MNIYLINSSLPMFHAVNLQKQSNEKSIAFIFHEPIKFSDSELLEAREVFSEVFIIKKSFRFFNIFKNYLFIKLKTQNINIKNLYVGTIGVNLLVLLYKKLKAQNKYLLEDGFETLAFSIQGVDYFNNDKSFIARKLFKHYFFLKNKKYKIISFMSISNNVLETIKVNLSDKENLKNKNPTYTNDLLIIGSNALDSNLLNMKNTEYSLLRLIKFHKDKYNIKKVIYRPHPREPIWCSEYLIDKFNMTLFDNDSKYTIFENFIINANTFPKYVCSIFPSSLFFTIPQITSCIKLSIYNFDDNAYLKYTDRILLVKKHLEKLDTINFVK